MTAIFTARCAMAPETDSIDVLADDDGELRIEVATTDCSGFVYLSRSNALALRDLISENLDADAKTPRDEAEALREVIGNAPVVAMLHEDGHALPTFSLVGDAHARVLALAEAKKCLATQAGVFGGQHGVTAAALIEVAAWILDGGKEGDAK